MKTGISILIFFLLSTGSFLHAQHAEAEAYLSQSQIRIGEQVELKLAVRYHEGSKKSVVIWPELKDTLSREIEIVKMDSIKTILASRASVLYQQSRAIIITAFDSGTYIIPSQKFVVEKDTIRTNALTLYVNTIPVDTTKPIKDIKGIYDVPPAPIGPDSIPPNHWWWWAIGAFALILILFLVLYFTRKKENLPLVPTFTKQLLPHEKVLEQLAELGRKKQWLHGELKLYHIALTEILRAWIVERYQIHALEMTTGEIIRTLNSKRVDSSALLKLERALRTSDMVKFAKGIPDPEENEIILQLAIDYVNATAIYPEPPIPQQQ
jgi:hypothetical protein